MCSSIALLNTDGSLDLSFSSGVNSGFYLNTDNGYIRTISIQPDRKIIVGGEFTYYNKYNDFSCNNISRLNIDGTFDQSFFTGISQSPSEGFSSQVLTIAIQADGKILAGGDFNDYLDNIGNNTSCNYIARINDNNKILICGATNGAGSKNMNGGILGGNNTSVSITANSCLVSISANGIYQSTFINIDGIGDCTDYTEGNYNANGGICGGSNFGYDIETVNYTFNNCQLINEGKGNINITGSTRFFNNMNGGICGGLNRDLNLNIYDCHIKNIDKNNIIGGKINSNGGLQGGGNNLCGGICGGNNSTLSIQLCNVSSRNIIIDGFCRGNGIQNDINEHGSNANGGICGGWNVLYKLDCKGCQTYSVENEVGGYADLLSLNANGGIWRI